MKYSIIHILNVGKNTSITFRPKKSNIQINDLIVDSFGNKYEIIGVELSRKLSGDSVNNTSILVKGVFKGKEFIFI